jgi:hypothetical protein
MNHSAIESLTICYSVVVALGLLAGFIALWVQRR